ncbi:MAG: class I SAM-dependent rRNA methyltransferase [Candidatus Riflebacteria bacterium]|nr:class I SAM-dependent rRNA methyltransferase [Candidatus Riflebacteria bacterium]
MKITKLILKKDRESQILKGHPWVYRDALKTFPAELENGSEIELFSHNSQFLAKGFYDSDSQIAARLIPCASETPLREQIIENIKLAILRRKTFFNHTITTGYRVINGEGDFLPGLIVDRYNDALSVQTYTPGLEVYLEDVYKTLLKNLDGVQIIWRRNQVRNIRSTAARSKEGLITGKVEPTDIIFMENGLKYRVNLVSGQKTGFFLDQRENRAMIRNISEGFNVANICGYTGAFTVAALAGKAKSVVTVDGAEPALIQAKKNLEINSFPVRDSDFIKTDMFQYLEKCDADFFDLMIVDPPSMAQSKEDIPKANHAYSKLNRLAFSKIKSGGFLYTASCSSQISRDMFLNTVAESAVKASRKALILFESHHAPDHPISLAHPEGRYLHGLLLQVL